MAHDMGLTSSFAAVISSTSVLNVMSYILLKMKANLECNLNLKLNFVDSLTA